MEKNWYSYKTKGGITLFYYNSDSGEHIWASGFEPLQCSKVQPEEVPLLEMCRKGHQMPRRKEKTYKSIGTETEEYFLMKDTATKFVRDIGISAVAYSSVEDDEHVGDDVDMAKPTQPQSFGAFPQRCLFTTDQPLYKTQEIVEQEYIDSHNHLLVDDLFAMEVSSAISTEDKPKGHSCDMYIQKSSGEEENSLPSLAMLHRVNSLVNPDLTQVPTLSGCPQITDEEGVKDEVARKVSTEHENEKLPKGCYLGLRVGKEGRIYVKSEPDYEQHEQEITDQTRIKQEIYQGNDEDDSNHGDGDGDVAKIKVQDTERPELHQMTRIKQEVVCQYDDDGDGGVYDDGDDYDGDDDVAKYSILDFLPEHPASDDSGNNSNPIPCDKCEKSFKKLSHLKRHMLIHTDSKPYACQICSKSFREANCLKKHIRTHTGEKPYNCSVCNKAFSQSQNLNKHMNIHTGKKPHKCEACGKAFSQHSHLARHKLIHTGEKPYECTKCGKAYRTSSHLVRHHKSSNH